MHLIKKKNESESSTTRTISNSFNNRNNNVLLESTFTEASNLEHSKEELGIYYVTVEVREIIFRTH